MRLVCPSCAAQYEVPDEAVPEEGREVQCGTCNTSWFQERPQPEPATSELRLEQPVVADEPASPEPETEPDALSADEPVAVSDPETPVATGEADEDTIFDSDKTVVAAAAPVDEIQQVETEPEPEPEPEVASLEEHESDAQPSTEPDSEMAADQAVAKEQEPAPAPIEEAETAPAKTERPSDDLDFDFDFDFEDDEPAPAATPEPAEEETTRVARFDKSLHPKPTDGRPKSPSWARETPQTTEPKPQREAPEDLSGPQDKPGVDDEDDLLAAVRGELDKLDDTPVRGPTLSGKRTGVAAAAQASGIVFDNELDDDNDFSAISQELGETLQHDSLEDLSAPRQKGSGPQFSIGFLTSVILFGLAYGAYLLGPGIAETVPQAAPYLTKYTETVDQTRRIVEELSGNALGFAEDKLHESDGS